MILIKLPKEQKDQMIARVQNFFAEERSETIGHIAAEQFVDFMLKELGPYIYNKAVQDARQLLLQQMASLEDELHSLEKPIK